MWRVLRREDDALTMFGFVRSAKDKTLALVLEKICHRHLREYTDMLEIRLDSDRRTLVVQALLKGEKEPVEIRAEGYTIEARGQGGGTIRFDRVRASREWLDAVVDQYLSGRSFPLPPDLPVALLEKLV
ncbi:MAG: hypothetical protein EOM25_06460 [Deltaproteobacteria bacterium]|nr:hypothetical protein [Deltaproteobacteria bacterium]